MNSVRILVLSMKNGQSSNIKDALFLIQFEF